MLKDYIAFLTQGDTLAFLAFGILTVGGAVYMLSLKKLMHSVLALALAFLGMAGLFVLLDAEFIAVAQILIYAGAVSILMLFGIMLTNHKEQQTQQPKRSLHELLLLVGVVLLFGSLFIAVGQAAFPGGEQHLEENNVKYIGEQLFTLHVIPFELVSVLLTVAFIGAIIIAKREED